MAEGERLGASFSIDVTELRTGLAQANRLIKESQSEFKAAAAGMDDWTKSEEGLNAKIKSLNDITDIQRKKVDALKTEYDRLVSEGMDPAIQAAIDLRTKINNEQAALSKNESELRKQQQALEELQNSSGDAADAMDDLGDAARDSGDGFTVAKGAAANFIANGLTALVGACRNAITSVLGLAEATQEYREDMGKLETAWETAGKSGELATQTYKNLYAALGEEDRSVEAVNHLAKFVETEEDMAKWTDICTGVWGTFGDSLPIEGLTENANEISKSGKLTGVLVDSLVWAGIAEDDFQASLDKCNTEQERAQLITETLNGLYGEAAENYKENNASIIEARNATSDYADAQAALGEAIEPLTTEFTKLKTQGLQWFVDTGFPFLKTNLPSIATLFAGVTAAIVAQTAATKIKIAMDAAQAAGTSLVTLAQQGLNAAMKANPIGLVITGITLLVSALMMLWNNCEGFRNFWIGLWNGITSKAGAAVESIKGFFEGLPRFFSNIWTNVKRGVTDFGLAIGNAIGGAIKAAINAVIGFIENRINWAIGLINGAIGLINMLPGVNVGSVPELNLPRLESGGVVNKATAAVLGEAGPERVIPLKDDAEWIDKVADKIVDRTGGGGVVVNQTNNYSQAHSRYEIYKSKQQTAAAVRAALGTV